MANLTQIVLSGYGILDTSSDVSIPLNFSVAEIQDISSRQGAWSKTITLPGTPTNKTIFGHLYDVNSIDSPFDYNKKTRCQIIQNGVPILDGYLQLINARKQSPSLGITDEQVLFDVLIKDATGDFFKTGMREKLLQELDFSQWDHVYTFSAVTASSAHTYADVYKYHLMNRQAGDYKLTDFTPNIFAKAYFDKIFEQAGYSYVWTGDTYDRFCKLVIPYNGDTALGQVDDAKFRAGWSSTTKQLVSNNSVTTQSYLPLLANDDSSFPNNDDNGLYNVSTGEYTQNIFAENQINVKYEWKMWASASTAQQLDFPNFMRFQIDNAAYLNAPNQISLANPQVDSFQINTSFIVPGGGQFALVSSGFGGFSYTIDANPGSIFEERVFVNTQFFQTNPLIGWVLSGTSTNTLPSIWPSFYLEIGKVGEPDNNFILANPSNVLKEGMGVFLNDFVPRNIKQKDLIGSIISMFNLYITTSKTKDNELIIQTRDEFYANGKELDWTKKIDINSEINLKYIPEVTNKRLVLTYKKDSDFYNKTYLDTIGDTYGQFEYIFGSEFVDSTKEVGPAFSPTPIVINSFGLAVPAINVQAPKNNIRVLYDAGWIPGEWRALTATGYTTAFFVGIIPFSSYTTFDTYPSATHFDNPYTPSYDIDFGLNQFEFYNTYEYLTNSNLYNNYYKRFLTQIDTGKLLTAKFKLTEFDIHNLDLRDKIWIFDAWYYINKIVDYNPNYVGQMTTVELLTVEDGLDFSEFQEQVTSVGGKFSYLDNLGTIDLGLIDNTIGIGVVAGDILGGDGNVYQDGSVRMRIAGNNNQGAIINGTITGDFNSAAGEQININGSQNRIG